jgi:hypothetical protein
LIGRELAPIEGMRALATSSIEGFEAPMRAAPQRIRRIPDLVVRAVDEAEARRRQLAGQEVAVIRLVGGVAEREEPIALPTRRVQSAPIAVALAAAFAIFGVWLGARGHVPRAREIAAAPAAAPIQMVSTPIVARPMKPASP